MQIKVSKDISTQSKIRSIILSVEDTKSDCSKSWNDQHTSVTSELSREELIDELVDLHLPTRELAETMVAIAEENDGTSFVCHPDGGVKRPSISAFALTSLESVFEDEDALARAYVLQKFKWLKKGDDVRIMWKCVEHDLDIYESWVS